jgi:hypothetical protein
MKDTELYFKEEDIEFLDKMLDCIAKNQGTPFRWASFERMGIPMTYVYEVQYGNYLSILAYYCASVTNESFGAFAWIAQSDIRTSKFKHDGGFRSYYERAKKREAMLAAKEKTEIEYFKWQITVNKWLQRTKWWPLILSILSLAVTIISLFR